MMQHPQVSAVAGPSHIHHPIYPSDPPFTMSSSQTQPEVQEKISAARREADGLKDRIRAAKDQTADTSCACKGKNSFCPSSTVLSLYETLTHMPSARHGQ